MSTRPKGSVEIIRATVGSELHGVGIAGRDDHDELGVLVEPSDYVVGLRSFDQETFRTKPEGVRSEHGDTDRVMYSLRKFLHLAMGGNPTILLLFFVPKEFLLTQTSFGEELQQNVLRFVSRRRAAAAFGGYLVQQRDRLLGIGKHMSRMPSRPELVDEYGFDTKYAMHMCRLGMQGVEFLETGKITLPFTRGERDWLISLRHGKITQDEAVSMANDELTIINEHIAGQRPSPVPAEADFEFANQWLQRTYFSTWGLTLWKVRDE